MEYVKPLFYKLAIATSFHYYLTTLCYRKISDLSPVSEDEDIDVIEERRRVMADENTENDVLVLKDLTKIFYSNEAGITNCSCSVSCSIVLSKYNYMKLLLYFSIMLASE